MIPAWLLASQGGILRAASISVCQKCGAPILAGLDSDRCAIHAKVDITPVDELGETVALMQGRYTYDLIGNWQRKELEYRYSWNINAPRRYPVLVEHRCGEPIPFPARNESRGLNSELPDEPPF